MAKNKSGLHITEERLEEMMKVFGDISKSPCINETFPSNKKRKNY